MAKDQIEAGRIGKPFGLRGEVYVHPDSDLGDVLVSDVACVTNTGRKLVVTKGYWHRARYIVKFNRIDNREDAEGLRNQVVFVDRSLIELADDAQWISELVGTTIVDPNGTVLGEVADVIDGFAHDYIVVKTVAGHKSLVPYVSALIDTSCTPFVLDAPEGLLELDIDAQAADSNNHED